MCKEYFFNVYRVIYYITILHSTNFSLYYLSIVFHKFHKFGHHTNDSRGTKLTINPLLALSAF